jgi:hypothetical protein
MLIAEGLATRRLGRGPGQVGKDIIASERIAGVLSDDFTNKWLVECKYTVSNGSISEKDVFNVWDRVKSQKANGYLLFTNARLAVNLEKTLDGLKRNSDIKVGIWTKNMIENKLIQYAQLFRKYFPVSFKKWLFENRAIYFSQTIKLKSPIVHNINLLRLLINAPRGIIKKQLKDELLERLLLENEKMLKSINDDLMLLKI